MPLRILIGLGSYHPELESAGSNQSIRALIRGLEGHAEFSTIGIVTPRERDAGEGPVVPWHWDGLCQTTRVPPGMRAPARLRAAVMHARPDILFLNGFFDTEITLPLLLLRRVGLIGRVPVVVSPRGEFSASALALKAAKKSLFLSVTRTVGLYRDVWLHATGDADAQDIAAARLQSLGILIAPNLGVPVELRPFVPGQSGEPLRLAFVGRISPMKNLDFAMRVLRRVTVPVRFDVYGPLSDPGYWRECESLLTELPPQVSVRRCGEIPNREVAAVLASYDLFFMPTRGENFGHSIREALMSGTPVLISDRTPWQDVEAAGAGWALPLSDETPFVAAIDRLYATSFTDRMAMRLRARALAEATELRTGAALATMGMFRRVLGSVDQERTSVRFAGSKVV